MLSTLTNLITGNEETEDIDLYDGSAADILFLYYLNLYQANDTAIDKGIALSSKVYGAYRNNQYNTNDFSGIIGSVGVFQNLDKFEIADTDVSGAFKQLDEDIFQKLIYGEINALSLENGITGVILFIFNRLEKCDPENLNLEQARYYETLILAIDELERQIRLNGTHIQDLSKAMLLMAKITAKAFYPEIVNRIFVSIETGLKQTIHKNEAWIQPVKFQLLYHLWQSNLLLNRTAESDFYLSEIYEFENQRMHPHSFDLVSFNEIQLIQQFNRLYWATTDSYFNKAANDRIHTLTDNLSRNGNPLRKSGLTGISGLGLTILSGFSKECLTWDETILLS
ncbi:hypothetical protein [Pedobacter frigoris]|uniref:Lanthionine synthetase C-like protein n=1 Tax=Pedobacter frigoris TaxID=2571272 RepID=A0A4U1CPI3_9SPHI|nr:hypothetical protein [Pedobacter frigoris]TKC07334.1 hypothetical protein FA047_08745 [Pedobacter frigoris]